MSNSKRNQRNAQGQYVVEEVRLFSKEMGSIHLPEQTMQSNEDSGNTGSEADVSPLLTPIESAKLEEQTILHELVCGGRLNFLPAWVFDSVEVPPSYHCVTCNRMVVLNHEETYIAI